MSGYGKPDDEQERATIRVEEQVGLIRSLLPSGAGSPTCIDCGELIPDGRRKALPGVVRCVDCQEEHGDTVFTAKQPWAT